MIEIYGKQNCVFCDKAKNLLESLSLPFKYLDIGTQSNKDKLFDLWPDAKTVPQIWWDGRYIGGFDELAMEIENTIGGYGHGKF